MCKIRVTLRNIMERYGTFYVPLCNAMEHHGTLQNLKLNIIVQWYIELSIYEGRVNMYSMFSICNIM